MSFTNKADISVIAAAEELTALARTYVNRDPQESKAAACAVSAAQDARNCLATVMNNTNYHPRAREHILSQDYWVHVTEYGTNQNYRFEIEEK